MKNLIYIQKSNHLDTEFKTSLKHGNVEILEFAANDLIPTLEKIVNVANQYEKIVVINEDAIIPFMFLSKQKGLIAASIFDEHSAYMTPAHNNTKVICLGTELSTPTLIKSMINIFFNKKYEGGRHKSRLDMLDKELEKE